MSNQTSQFLRSNQPRRWKIRELIGALDLQVTQVAAAQGTASASPGAGNPTLQVTPQPSWAGTPAGIFSPTDAEQLLGCRTSELRESSLQRTTTGSP